MPGPVAAELGAARRAFGGAVFHDAAGRGTEAAAKYLEARPYSAAWPS